MTRSGFALLAGAAALAGTSAVAAWAASRGGATRAIVSMQPLFAKKRAYTPLSAAKGAVRGGLSVDPADYPMARRDGDVVEELHGVAIADPYRWLEDPDAPETAAFVDAQNAVTAKVLSQCSTRDAFASLLEGLMDYPKYGTPFKKGERYYYSHNTGLQAQHVLYSSSSPDGADAMIFLDPNGLSSDGTVALGSYGFSRDGTKFAYALSSGGSDWRTVHVSRVDPVTGERLDLADRLQHVKFSPLAWTADGAGFFYCRYPAPATTDAGTETAKAEHQELAYHVAGTSQDEDAVILRLGEEHPDWMLGCELTDDGKTLLLTVSKGCEPANLLWSLDLDALPTRAVRVDLSTDPAASTGAPDGRVTAPLPTSVPVPDFTPYDVGSDAALPLPIVRLVDEFRAEYGYVGDAGDTWIFQTNDQAGRYRLVKTPKVTNQGVADARPVARSLAPSFSELVPERPDALLEWTARLAGDAIVLAYLHDVHAVLELHSAETGQLVREIDLPGIGSVGSFSGNFKSSEFFLTFTGFTEPGLILRGDAAAPPAPLAHLRRMQPRGFDPDAFTTEQVFATSKDGTRVPMFVVRPKDAPVANSEIPPPTLLYGYGGFNISLTPGFSASRVAWLLAYGGTAVVANLRGGGEYGTAWRDAGSRHEKQNVFDDFIASAEHLISTGVATPSSLVIQGGSNGGLLVAATAEQRPDLFAAVLCQVGVLDMLRFHRFTIGHAWVTDYGSADVGEDFPVLLRYSPLHNVAIPEGSGDGALSGALGQYPAFMITTGDHDDRVVPLHSLKFAATLQHVLAQAPGSAATQTNPLLARVEVRAGHGAGKPTAKVIAEVADLYAFAAAATRARWVGPETKAAVGAKAAI